jgi:hypothetical protein
VLAESRIKTGVGEEATDADSTAFCTTAASIRSFRSLRQSRMIEEESKKQFR